jgi:glycosyltransferase involved in cell wall biosynthesis
MSVRVLMVGPAPTGQGGIVSVARLLLRYGRAHAEIRYVPTHRDGSLPRRILAWLAGSARAALLLIGRRVDVLHAHVSERGSVLRKGILLLLARICRVPVVFHCHGAEFVGSYRRLPWAGRALVRWLFRRASLLLVLGEHWRAVYIELLKVCADRVVVLENPVALPAVLPDRGGRDGVRVLFLGRYGARKGSADVLAAMAALPPEVRGAITLRMAGDGEVDQTRALAARLAVAARVEGWLRPAERDAALAEADVFVLPSRDEGLPMALLEAMAWGLVPVVTPVGSIPELVYDNRNGLLVRPSDVDGLARALVRLAGSPVLRAELAAAARSSVEPYAADTYAARLAKEWVGCVSARGRQSEP